jgi:DNA (cytosine-5)-methyltransferase 1
MSGQKATPILLDLFCKAGGASMGYHRAGFRVVGVDIDPQPRYPFEFVRADAMTFPLDGFDVIHASPPCQRYTALKSVVDVSGYEDLVGATRARLESSGALWVIENVIGAPLRRDLVLCAAPFGLRSYRHRIFESNAFLWKQDHPGHLTRVNRRKKNRRGHWDAGGFVTVVGDIGSYVGPEAMGIDWMTGNELSQAIPPAYTEYIGRQLMAVILR